MEVLIGLLFVGVLIFFAKNDSANRSLDSNYKNHKKPLFQRDKLTFSEEDDLVSKKDFFDTLLEYPLTEEQRRSIVSEADRTLVIASAGSGKTSTILAKYAYLTECKKVNPSEILVLAFARPVVNEVKRKLKNLTGKEAIVETFHSLGFKILNFNAIEKLKIDSLADDSGDGLIATKLMENLAKKIQLKDPSFFNKIRNFNILCQYPEITEFAKNEKEYNAMLSKYPYKRDAARLSSDSKNFSRLPVINGKFFVRSQQELAIANYLIINGVEFDYEKSFPLDQVAYIPTSSKIENEKFQAWDSYKPDFYFPEADLWYEHFAINKNTNYCPFKEEGYFEEYEKKIKFHKENNTNFFCTYMSDYYEDTILDLIDAMLEKNNILKKPLSTSEVNLSLKNIYTNNVLTLTKDIIKLFKTSEHYGPFELLKNRFLAFQEDKFRAKRFLKVFIPLLEEYEADLSEKNSIDFEDMIVRATDCKEKYNFKYILVDEYQDISYSRYIFLRSLCEYKGNAKLFCVGDDWQSIYRFTGSNMDLFTDYEKANKTLNDSSLTKVFSEEIGYGEITESIKESGNESNNISMLKIESVFENEEIILNDIKEIEELEYRDNRIGIFKIQENFRYGQNISKLSSEFIQKNPNQLLKKVKTNNDINLPIYFCNFENYEMQYLKKILQKVPTSKNGIGSIKSVLFLARRNDQLENIDFKELKKIRPDLTFNFDTIHSAKGSESDIVIILGLEGGSSGFPRWDNEDPLKSMFLANNDDYLYSEERRVMYVAMTRAKKQLFICYKGNQSSSFYEECKIICKNLEIDFIDIIIKSDVLFKCPKCHETGKPGGLKIKTKKLNSKKGSYVEPKVFLGCNLYNPEFINEGLYCDYAEFGKKVKCPKCMEDGKTEHILVTKEEGKLFLTCSACNFKDNYFNYHS